MKHSSLTLLLLLVSQIAALPLQDTSFEVVYDSNEQPEIFFRSDEQPDLDDDSGKIFQALDDSNESNCPSTVTGDDSGETEESSVAKRETTSGRKVAETPLAALKQAEEKSPKTFKNDDLTVESMSIVKIEDDGSAEDEEKEEEATEKVRKISKRDVASDRPKRALIFRPLFVYRQQEIKRQQIKDRRKTTKKPTRRPSPNKG